MIQWCKANNRLTKLDIFLAKFCWSLINRNKKKKKKNLWFTCHFEKWPTWSHQIWQHLQGLTWILTWISLAVQIESPHSEFVSVGLCTRSSSMYTCDRYTLRMTLCTDPQRQTQAMALHRPVQLAQPQIQWGWPGVQICRDRLRP